MTRLLLLPIVCVVLAVCGCGNPAGSSPDDNGDSQGQGPEVLELMKKDASALPIGDELPVLDGGRLVLSKPTGWDVPPRDAIHVVRFNRGNSEVPHIVVKVEPAPAGEFQTVSEDSVEKFAVAVQKELAEKKLVEPVRPMVIGETPCVRYVIGGRLKGGGRVDRQVLVVQSGGRRYTIELRVVPGKLKDGFQDRDAAYAVAASMTFLNKEGGGDSDRSGSDDDSSKTGG